MTKGPEEFGKMEDKFKLSLLKVEKRFVDLELMVNELKEKLQEANFEEIKNLKERIDDLEDLIMVEQAGIIELKKMMEDVGSKLKPPQLTVPDELKERIAKIEQQVAKPVEFDKDSIQQQVQSIVDEISSLRSEMNKELMSLKEGRSVTGKAGIDVQFLSSKFDSLKTNVDELHRRKVEADVKIQTIEKILSELQTRSSAALPENLAEEIKNNRKDWMVVNGRIDSLENVVKDISETVPKLEASLGKFESFEKASLLSKELENKIEKFKFIENEMRRLSSRMEMIYDSVDKRLDKIKGIEKKFPELNETISKIMKDVDRNKIELIDAVKKEDLENITKDFESKMPKMESINSRINSLESMMASVQKEYENLAQGKPKTSKDVVSRIDQIEKSVNELKSLINMIEMQRPSDVLESQMNEIVERLVFLESRLSAIESMFKQSTKIQPIILE